ncbi:hypothetical protein HZC09_01040 [Candidatus Micrarchaeota archaeon]|nr:hypothetical protein [Candidatus Micrarchaeota archaeon]
MKVEIKHAITAVALMGLLFMTTLFLGSQGYLPEKTGLQAAEKTKEISFAGGKQLRSNVETLWAGIAPLGSGEETIARFLHRYAETGLMTGAVLNDLRAVESGIPLTDGEKWGKVQASLGEVPRALGATLYPQALVICYDSHCDQGYTQAIGQIDAIGYTKDGGKQLYLPFLDGRTPGSEQGSLGTYRETDATAIPIGVVTETLPVIMNSGWFGKYIIEVYLNGKKSPSCTFEMTGNARNELMKLTLKRASGVNCIIKSPSFTQAEAQKAMQSAKASLASAPMVLADANPNLYITYGEKLVRVQAETKAAKKSIAADFKLLNEDGTTAASAMLIDQTA